MTRLVLTEGPSDRGVVEAIAELLNVPVRVLVMRGNRLQKAIRAIRAQVLSHEYSKVIVLKDLHKRREIDVEASLAKLPPTVAGVRVLPIAVGKAIEAWLLADSEGPSQLLRVSISVADPGSPR